MTEKWVEVPDSVLLLAQELVREHHPDLQDARIGIIFRETVAYSRGNPVLGHAQKTPEMMQVYLDFDFVIWIAADAWADMNESRRKALIDHLLCHCKMVEGVATMVGHDIEEFEAIINRHGLWSSNLVRIADTIKQMAFDLGEAKEAEKIRGHIGNVSLDAMIEHGQLTE
jgi:hypothetical protein